MTPPDSAIILSGRMLTADTTLIRIATVEDPPPRVFTSFAPGQFVQLSVPGVGEMPISYCGMPAGDGTVELCVRSIGRVSSAVTRLAVGSILGVRGPLGHGFPVKDYAGKNLLLIAGGVGIATIRSLLQELLQKREQYKTITLLHGARNANGFIFEDENRSLAANGQITYMKTVDAADEQGGRDCHIGLLPDLMAVCALDPATTVAAICAPPAAYPSLTEALRVRGFADSSMYLSLERQMKCGIGQCGHCAVGTLLCCTDGPVFSLSQLSDRYGITV